MKTFRMIFKLLGFAFAIGFALGTPTPMWADEIPPPRLMIRNGTEQIYEGTAVLTHSELGTLVRAHPDLMIPAVRFPEGLPLLKERAVIPSSLQLKDQTLPGFATVNAKLLGRTPDGGQIIRYEICGGYGETACHASAAVSLVRIFYSIP